MKKLSLQGSTIRGKKASLQCFQIYNYFNIFAEGFCDEAKDIADATEFYWNSKGIDNVTIHTIEHDIVLTHDIIFDYLKNGKLSPVINLNY